MSSYEKSKQKFNSYACRQQFTYNKAGELLFYGHNLSALKMKTPSYVYSRTALQNRARLFLNTLKRSFGSRAYAHYAMKANSNSRILKLFKQEGFQVDVVSFGEMKLALDAGYKPSQVLFSGVGKTKEEIRFSIQKKIFQLNVESLPELVRIGELCKSLKKTVGVALRVNPGVNPKTHPYIATGLKENKFGIDFLQIAEALEILHQYPLLKYQGLSLHIGSQIFEFGAIQSAIKKIIKMDQGLSILGFKSIGIDIGGGLGILYSKNAEIVDEKNLSKFMVAIRSALKKYSGQIRLEPGRFIVARSGGLLTEVQYIKKTPYKNFAIVDTGMNHLLRPALYHANHRIFEIQKNQKKLKKSELYDVVGTVCESSDVFAVDQRLSNAQEGAKLFIADAGAYGYTMASQYNSFSLPEEIFI